MQAKSEVLGIRHAELLSLAMIGLMTLKDDLEDKIDSVSALMASERGPTVAPIAKASAKAAGHKSKRKLSAAGRKAIADAQKKRWAKKRADK